VAGAGWLGPEGDLFPAMLELAPRCEKSEHLVEREAIAVAVPVHRVRAERAGRRVSESFDTRSPSHLLEKGKKVVAENGRALRDESVHPKRLPRKETTIRAFRVIQMLHARG
jgi:hypothetical protein